MKTQGFNRGLQLFRALIPSWRFFDQSGVSLGLFYKVENGSWQNALEENESYPSETERAERKLAQRKLSSIFLNSEGNYHLACYSLLQQLIDDLDEWDEKEIELFHESVSFRLVKNLVIRQIWAQNLARGSMQSKSRDFQFQFKVSYLQPTPDDILISPVYSYERGSR